MLVTCGVLTFQSPQPKVYSQGQGVSEQPCLPKGDTTMESQSPMNEIRHLRLDFHGSAYRTTLDAQVRSNLLQDGIDPIIRGQFAVAAGVSLGVDVVISLVTGVTSGLIVEAIKGIMRKIRKAAKETLSSDCHLGRMTIEMDTCDFVIATNGSAGFYAENVNYNELISRMMDFYEQELAAGHAIYRIEAPCNFNLSEDRLKSGTSGVGNFSLWLVTYRYGSRWPCCIYDAINDVIIPTEDKEEIKKKLQNL